MGPQLCNILHRKGLLNISRFNRRYSKPLGGSDAARTLPARMTAVGMSGHSEASRDLPVALWCDVLASGDNRNDGPAVLLRCKHADDSVRARRVQHRLSKDRACYHLTEWAGHLLSKAEALVW